MDIEKVFKIITILALCGLVLWWLVPIILVENHSYHVAETVCTNSGYQIHKLKNNSWYCITYGLEPDIIRVGTKWELAKLYGEK